MSDFEAMVNAHLGAAQRKQSYLDDKAKQKQDYLDPVFEFGVDDVKYVDQDTVELPSGQRVRLSAGEGRTFDSYEADSPEAGVTGRQKYAERPDTFEAHRHNYARAYGLDPDDVTVDDLVNAGNSQKAKAQERFRQMADERGRIRYRERGTDDYGRVIGELDPDQVNLSGRQDNAAYYSKFNYEQTLEDFDTGERSAQSRGAGGRSLKTGASDQVVNFVAGAGRMANDLVQGAGTLVGINNIPGVDEGHSKVREAIESFKDWGNSPQQLRRERLEGERAELQSEFYNQQREKYIRDGSSELHASIRAGIDEFVDSVGNVIDNPGAILDKTVESLPYMLGVAGVGKAATTKALKAVQNKVLLRKGVQKNISKGLEKTKGVPGTKGRFQTAEALENTAAWHTQQFINSKAGQAYLKKVQTISGVTTVGLTEGLSTSADVYDSIINMTEEQAANSEKYLGLRNRGLSHEKALEELAEDASWQTFLTVSLAAGAASWATGAGAFEAQLFTGLKRVSKTAAGAAKKTAADVAKKQGKEKATGIVKGALGLGYRGTKATVKHLGPGSAKEGTEELLQSGGGEFLSQLASFEATGEQVGPGVGRAAGEGFVVGLASGGLAEATLGSIKKIAATDPNKLLKAASDYRDKVDGKAKIRQAVAGVKGEATPQTPDASGNTPPPPPPAPETPEIDADPSGSFQAELDNGETNPVIVYDRLKKIQGRANATNQPLNKGQEEIVGIYKSMAKEALAQAVEDINQKKSEDITNDDMAVLRKAAELGVETINRENLSEDQVAALDTESQLAEEVEAAERTAAEIQQATPEDQQTAVQKVHDQKFGDVKNANGKGRHGLGYYNRRMRELMNVLSPNDAGTESNSELDSLMRGLRNFTGSQTRYLDAVRQAVRTQANAPIEGTNKEVVYTAPSSGNKGGTQGLERLLTQEQEQFTKVREGLIKRYRQWEKAGKAGSTVRSSADRQGQQEARAAQQAEAKTRKKAKTARERAEVPDPEGRTERLKIRQELPEFSRERMQRLIGLRRRLSQKNSKDFTLLEDLKAEVNTIRKRREQARNAGKTEADFAEEIPTGRRERRNAFTPRNEEELEDEAPQTTSETAEAPQQKTIRQAVEEAASQGSGVQQLLEYLRDSTKNKAYSVLAARLMEMIGDTNIRIIPMNDAQFIAATNSRGKVAKGAFLRSKGGLQILLNTDRLKTGNMYQATILHEAIHAAINGHIKNGISKELNNRLRQLNLEVVRALSANGSPAHVAMARILAANPEELLTHGITTPFLQEFLRNHKVGKTSLLDKVFKFIADLLGVPNNSALNEVLSITDAIFKEIEVLAGPAKDSNLIRHYTLATNVASILKNGFDFSKKPLHVVKGLESGRFGENTLYFTKDDVAWNTSGDTKLVPIDAKIKKGSKVLTINSWTAAEAYMGQRPNGSFTENNTYRSFMEALIAKAQEDGYQILNLANPTEEAWANPNGGKTKYGENSYYRTLTGASGKDDFFVFDPAAITIETQLTSAVEAEANSEGADTTASAGVNATEQEAEAGTTTPVTVSELEAKDARDKKAARLSELRRMRTLFENNKITVDDADLTNEEDAALLKRLLNEGVPPAQAIEQVLASIEPNPVLRDLTLDPAVPAEVIEQTALNGAQLNTTDAKPVAATSILGALWNYVQGLTDAAIAGVQKVFTQRKLGVTASDSWELRSRKVRDLLASDDQIMDILTDPASREIFFEKVGTTPAEERALRTFANFYTRFYNKLHETLEKERKVDIAAGNQAAQNPLYFFRDQNTGKIHPNVVAAMALESMQYLVGAGAQSIRNTDDDIRSILGIDEFSLVDPLARQVLGSGTLQVNTTQEIGRKAFAHLNLKLKTEARPLGQEVLEAAMGAQALGVLTQLGTTKTQNGRTDPAGTFIPRVERIPISRALWNQLKDIHANERPRTKMNRQIDEALGAEGDIILVTNKLDDSWQDPETGQFPEIDVNARMRDNITEGRDIFQRLFSSTASVRTPMFRKPNINDIAKKVYRSMTDIPQTMRDRMLHDAQQHWQADTELLDLVAKFGSPEKYLEIAHAYLSDEEIGQLHEELQAGAVGRNQGLMRDLTEALRWNRRYKDRKFYLPMKMTRNGRFIIDSNVINPQSNKLHRFMFVRDQWTRTVTKGKLTDTEYQGLMMAIGLGMGIKTDSTPVSEVVSQVEEAFNDPNSDWSKAMQAIQNVGDAFTDEQLADLAKVLSKENTHTFAALNAAAKWFGAKDGQKVTISLPHETDGVTNGYIIGLLATPPAEINKAYRELLNAGGIYFDDDPWKNLAEYKAEGKLDNYQHIAQDTRKNLEENRARAKAVEDKVIAGYAKARKIRDRIPGRDILVQRATHWVAASGLVPSSEQLDQLGNPDAAETKEGRNWAKVPLMVMSYGAGWASVGRQIVSNAVEKFYTELSKAAHPDGREATAEDIAVAMNRAFRIINMVAMANNRANVPNIITDEQGETQFLKFTMQLTDGKRHTLTAADVQFLADSQFGGSLTQLATKFRLNKMQMGLLRTGLNLTYGAAMQEAMNTRLSPVMNVRGRLNASNQLANMMYVAEYDRQIQALRDADTVVTSRHKQRIQEDLLRQGLVPTIQSAESTGVHDSLEMVSYGNEYLRVQKNLAQGVGLFEGKLRLAHKYWGLNGQERVPDLASSITGRITTRVPDADVGVSAVVKSIHALDGVINSLVWGQGKYPVLNVHDAQVSPWYAAAGIAQSANVAFGETIAGYDMPQQFNTMLNRIMGSLWSTTDNRLSKEVRDEIALQMNSLEEAFNILDVPPPDIGDPTARGYMVIEQLRLELANDQVNSLGSKTTIFNKIRSINQFAQQGTEILVPNGINLNEPTAWAGTQSVTPTVEEVLLDDSNNDIDVQFAEEFENQLESEKIISTWEGLVEWETHSDIDTGHQNHLRTVVRDIVRPGLQTVEPIMQEVLEQAGTDGHQAEWEGDILRLKTAGAVLTSNADVTLQERAAQEYVYNIVDYGVNNDHFIRKELGRLFDLAKNTLTPASFRPAEVVGDPQIARERAQERYDYIFNNTDANKAYKRFLSIGLTNKPMIDALSAIDNQDAPFVAAPDWSKGILRGMMSVFRQMVQKMAGVSQRYNGGTVSDALTALSKATIASNQRNQQRLKDLRTGADGTSRVQRINERLVTAINDRFVEPLAKGLEATHQKRLDPKNPTLPGFLKAATYVALKSRDDEVRDHYNRFYRELTNPYGVGKDNWVFQTIAEVTPWPEDQLSWIGLLRKSKYIVDMARQEANDHTRSFINDSFDKNNYMSKAHKMAMTNVLLKTDLSSLIDSEHLDLGRLAELLADPNARDQETNRLEVRLRQELARQGVDPKVFFLFQNQARSLASYMTNGQTTVENGMLNAHNIVNQYMLDNVDRVALKNVPAMESIVDRLASMYALNMQTQNDLRLTNDIVQHEMSRTDVPADNGFSRLIGMHIDFKELAKEKLFKDQPIQMIKGYVYEIFDGDVNVEYVEEGSDRQAELEADGMILVGELPKDSHDIYKGKRLLYKGMKGLNTYNKSIVSLTDLQHRGANLFSTNGYQSQTSLNNLGWTRSASFATATRQFKPNFSKPGANMVPVLNNAGKIVDYRYMMSESNKRKILKKEDPFDRVLPRMFASISDRNNTEVINQDVLNLLQKEWQEGRNDPGKRFIKVGRTSTDQAGRDMWNLLPENMQRNARAAFGFDGIYVRDEVANLVLGFRKATVSNLKKPGEEGGTLWGKSTPVVRLAEKVWLEIVQLMRIKIAILTPAVVVGNIASNFAMLLSEGIPLNYIRKKSAEAISSMRQYQKDQKAATELMRQIGSRQALGQNTRSLEVRLARLNADLAANPVAELVRDGLFTSITADLGVDDDTIRGSMIQKAEDALGNRGGRLGKAAAHVVKEAYMLPGSKGYQAAVAATQYGDFVGRYVKFKYDTQVNKKDREAAINDALASFIYYDIPQPKYLQALNDSGLVMFTKFFLRIQHIVARMYTQNPLSAFSILALQKNMLADPFSENIMNYGMGDGLTNKWNNPLNLPGKAWNTLNPTEPALLQWILNPFGL